MPELPEVETVRRGLAPVLVGACFDLVEQRRADLRFPFPPDFAARLTGRRVTALRRRAKYLLADLDDGETLVMHLGMSGSFRIADDADENTPGLFHNSRGKNDAHDHVVFHLSNGKRITYNDPRRFGFMLLIKAILSRRIRCFAMSDSNLWAPTSTARPWRVFSPAKRRR